VARYRKKPVVIEAVQWRRRTMLPVDLWPDAVGKGTIERVMIACASRPSKV
jgi:hypothetical protein